MKVSETKLEWTNKCCGCYEKIPIGATTHIISELAGVDGSIHLCDKCIREISLESLYVHKLINQVIDSDVKEDSKVEFLEILRATNILSSTSTGEYLNRIK